MGWSARLVRGLREGRAGDGAGSEGMTYVSNMAREDLAGEAEVALLLGGEDALLLVQPAGKLDGHAVAEVLSHGAAAGLAYTACDGRGRAGRRYEARRERRCGARSAERRLWQAEDGVRAQGLRVRVRHVKGVARGSGSLAWTAGRIRGDGETAR